MWEKRTLSRFLKCVEYILFAVVALLVVAALWTSVAGEPRLATVVRSASMEPTLSRGDLVYTLAGDGEYGVGDLVIFRPLGARGSPGGWFLHRIVGEIPGKGFLTQGDANEVTDQENGLSAPVAEEAIVGFVPQVGRRPVKLPLVGLPLLWMENVRLNSGLAVVLVGLVAVSLLYLDTSSWRRSKVKRRGPSGVWSRPAAYLVSGFVVVLLFAALTVSTSMRFDVRYTVDADRAEVFPDGLGVLKQGSVLKRPLAEVSNGGFLPLVVTVRENDPNLELGCDLLYLAPQGKALIEMELRAGDLGEYVSPVHIGVFLPVLPSRLIHCMTGISFWLAVAVTSLMPGLPLILLPVCDSGMRHRLAYGAVKLVRHQ